MYVITYSLRENEVHSRRYYQDIAIFTNEVLSEIENIADEMIKGYMSYMTQKGNGRVRSKKEYGFELLALGTLWHAYSGDAQGLETVPRQLLTDLTKLREQGGTLKPGIDFIRGIMSTIFLSPDLYDNLQIIDPTLEHMEILINWLDATGEFSREVKRFRQWSEYFKTLTEREISDTLATAITLAAWFETRSEEEIGKYTLNVERYLNEIRPNHYWHEDVIFCGRRRAEYHLNMVGAEIMNRGFRDNFLKTKKKLVLLPACMRLLPASKCKAVECQDGFHCSACMPTCSVNRLMKLGKKNGFDVIVVPHESSISAVRNHKTSIGQDTGVVGVACVLNLVSGGWMLEDLGIPAQCVLLDYCGCKNHWSKEGFPTEINMDQLKSILGIK